MNVAWAELLLASLRDAGCADVVVSPGSRSTPLVLAAARLGLPCHVVIDERVAAFFALGRARATGRPSALVCTSGTAGAHYLPALIEASHARVPLVVLTADRPPELHGCAAPQTIDQQHLFGRFARGFVDLGLPDAHPAALRGLRRRAARMVALSLGPEPGPVHLNVPARVPLEASADAATQEVIDAIAREPVPRAAATRRAATDETIAQLALACRGAERGLIVAGPLPVGTDRSAIAALARVTGFPLAAEAGSQLRFGGDAPLCDAFDLLMRAPAWRAAHRPDLVIELGAPPTSGPWARAADGLRDCRRVVIAPHGWNDPTASADVLVHADVADTAARIAARLGPARTSAWAEAWSAANRRARAWVDRSLRDGDEHTAVRAAVDTLPDGALLVLGNSLPVRVVDTACAASARQVDVVTQRGACGIDGLVAGAAGAASATRRPTALLLGDVSFAHDIGGLAAARLADTPLAIVVIDNAGGRIFEQLPVAATPGAAEVFERFFLTPPGLDVAAAAAAYGIPSRAAGDVDVDVAAEVRGALERPGATVLHVRVSPHSARDLDRAAAASLDEALA